MARRRKGSPNWTKYSDERLLKLRVSDLDLDLKSSLVWPSVERLYNELELKGLKFRPHIWISDEWFSPDGVPGIAVPFYVLHPRLIELEKKMMNGEIEGEGSESLIRLLRHEAGHALDNAFGLRRKRKRQQMFGRTSGGYPSIYSPTPYSRDFVSHFDGWYAQAHPDEDWAETFATWLDPESDWKKNYRDWPALKKLELVDEMMREIRDTRQKVRNRLIINPMSDIRITLSTFYKRRHRRIAVSRPRVDKKELLKLFSSSYKYGNPTASRFLRDEKGAIAEQVSRWTGQHSLLVLQTLEEMISHCQELNLRLRDSKRRTFVDVVSFLSAFVAVKLSTSEDGIPL